MSETLAHWRGTTQAQHDIITRGALERFSATIDSAQPPDAVPQGFHWCLCLPSTSTAALCVDGHPPKGGFLPPVELPRRMWAASDVAFRAPLPVSAVIERASTITEITEKNGRAGKLVFVKIDHTVRADGAVCIVERQTIVYREPATSSQDLPPARGADLSSWPWRRSILPQAAMLFRYSALTFNAHRIHYDLPFAREAEGYPGLIVHGPLMATLLLDLCARALGPNCLSRFSFRAMSPAFCGQDQHLVGRPGDTLELQALGADGRVVMSATGWR